MKKKQAIIIILFAAFLALLHYLSGYGQDLHLPIIMAPSAPSPCACSGDLYSCGSFGSQYEAQLCYDRCMVLGLGDIHRISDGAGRACVAPAATPTPAPTAVPTPTATPLTSCDCSYDRYNCGDFIRWADAQGCFLYCYAEHGDVHELDADRGGIPGITCEDLPGRPLFCPIP